MTAYRVRYLTQDGFTDTTIVDSSSPDAAMRALNWSMGRLCAVRAAPEPTLTEDVALLSALGVEL